MNKKEVTKLLMVLETTYPNFKIKADVADFTVNTWQMLLEGYNAEEVNDALVTFIRSSGSAFAPSASQLIECINRPKELAEFTESGAWALVSKAIRNSAYHSEEEFAKLPPMVQKAVGSPAQLKAWATDEEFNEEVAAGQFARRYTNEIEHEKSIEGLSPNARAKYEALTQQTILQLESHRPERVLIEHKEKTVTPAEYSYTNRLREILDGSSEETL